VHAGLHCDAVHDPPRHICDAVLHGLPHVPQLCGSLFVLTHAPLQQTRPIAHVHGLPVSGGPPPSFFVVPSEPESVPPPSIELIVPPHATRATHKPSERSFIQKA
jgi:hypothetical protein